MNYERKFCKTSSKKGASILIALLVFLLAALSGTVALTMAASNAGRYAHEKDDQQAYLSVVSAAKLILSRLEGITVIYRGKEEGLSPTSDSQVDIEYLTSNKDLFLKDENFEKALRSISLPTPPDLQPVVFELSSDTHSEIGTVYVSVSITGSSFAFRLYHEKNSARNYQMTLEVDSIWDGDYHLNPGTKYFERTMSFETASAKFTVERNVSGGAGE